MKKLIFLISLNLLTLLVVWFYIGFKFGQFQPTQPCESIIIFKEGAKIQTDIEEIKSFFLEAVPADDLPKTK